MGRCAFAEEKRRSVVRVLDHTYGAILGKVDAIQDSVAKQVTLGIYNSGLSAHFNGRGICVKNASAGSWVHMIDTTVRHFCIDIDNFGADIDQFTDNGANWVVHSGRVCVEDLRSNCLDPFPARCAVPYMTPMATPDPPDWGDGYCTPIPTAEP